MKLLRNLSLIAATSAFMLVGCSEDDVKQNYNDPNDPAAQTFAVHMTDKPGDYAELNVKVTSVSVFHAESGWKTLDSTTQSMNVMDYVNGETAELAFQSNMEEGRYTKLKITFDPVSTLVLQNGYENGPLSSVASATNTLAIAGSNEIVIEIDETVDQDRGASVTVDYNVAQSVTYNGDGTFTYRPVINDVKDESTGIEGDVQGTNDAVVLLTNGTDTLSTMLSEEARFSFKGLEEGIYSLVIDPATKDMDSVTDTTFSTVVVYQGQMTQMGTINLSKNK